MAIGGRHVVVVALVTLLLTYAAFEGKSSSSSASSSARGESVSVVGRKGLADPQEVAPAVVAEESTITSQDTSEEQTSEESSDQTSEETSEEATDQTSDEQTSDEQTFEQPTSEESDEQTSEELTSEETSTDQAFNQDFKEEVTEIFSGEVSDEPVVEEIEPSTEESTSEVVTTEESTTEEVSTEESTTEEVSTEESTTEEFATEEPTVVEESWNAEEVQAQENVEFPTDASEETSFERTQVREMEEVMAPQTAPPAGDAAAAAPSTIIENPDSSNYPKPKDNPNVFLQEIAQDNAMARQNERFIQSCIQEDGCGTP